MRYLRWKKARYAVPAAVLAGLGVAAFVPALSGASVPPGLPAQTPQQLLADMAAAKVPPLSGTLSWQPYLGLSDLSALEPGGGQGGDGSGFDPLTLLSASYQVNVWLDGATAEHLALIEPSAQEVDLVRNGHQAWLWDSSNQSVLHVIGAAPASPSTSTGTGMGTNEMPLTPDQLASRLLSHLSPSTSVTAGQPLYIAGEPAYQLNVAPKDAPGSTVKDIEIDVGATAPLLGVPLQVAIYANGQSSAALQLGFTGQVSLGTPPASELTFTPPPGSSVVTRTLGPTSNGGSVPFGEGWSGVAPAPGATAGSSGAPGPLTRTGSGWETVTSGPAGQVFSSAEQGTLSEVTRQVEVTQPGSQPVTGRLFSTHLLNVLLMPDGRFYAGLVTPSVLTAAASAAS